LELSGDKLWDILRRTGSEIPVGTFLRCTRGWKGFYGIGDYYMVFGYSPSTNAIVPVRALQNPSGLQHVAKTGEGATWEVVTLPKLEDYL